MTRILMTGATGFLGSNLLNRLVSLPNEHEITILKRSFSNTSRIDHLLDRIGSLNLDKVQLTEIFQFARYDTILHCATDYGRKEIARAEMIETNLLLPLRLLETGLRHGVSNFVNTDTLLDKRVSAYALSKRQFREWLKYSSKSINATTVSLEHFYGPGDDETKFVSSVVRAFAIGTPSIPLTPGEQQRDFIYIDDVIEAFMYILANIKKERHGYSEYEVGSGRPLSIKAFVSLAKLVCQNDVTQLGFGMLPYRTDEPMTVNVNTSRLQALGWRSRVGLEEGLRRTFNFEKAKLK